MQGWLHAALWPLHDALLRALSHLTRHDATWRPGVGRLEGIHDVPSYLGAAGRANLDDLLACDGAALHPAIERHAAAIATLVAAAVDAQPAFERMVRQAASRERRTRGADDVAISAVAAHLINGTLEWSIGPEGPLLEALRGELAGLRASGPPALDAAYRDATASTEVLLAEIDRMRRTLCDTYDLPPAPISLHVHNGHGHEPH